VRPAIPTTDRRNIDDPIRGKSALNSRIEHVDLCQGPSVAVNAGSRPALGAPREINQSTAITSPETIETTAAPRNPRRVRLSRWAAPAAMVSDAAFDC
jgi:hypothetical protein